MTDVLKLAADLLKSYHAYDGKIEGNLHTAAVTIRWQYDEIAAKDKQIAALEAETKAQQRELSNLANHGVVKDVEPQGGYNLSYHTGNPSIRQNRWFLTAAEVTTHLNERFRKSDTTLEAALFDCELQVYRTLSYAGSGLYTIGAAKGEKAASSSVPAVESGVPATFAFKGIPPVTDSIRALVLTSSGVVAFRGTGLPVTISTEVRSIDGKATQFFPENLEKRQEPVLTSEAEGLGRYELSFNPSNDVRTPRVNHHYTHSLTALDYLNIRVRGGLGVIRPMIFDRKTQTELLLRISGDLYMIDSMEIRTPAASETKETKGKDECRYTLEFPGDDGSVVQRRLMNAQSVLDHVFYRVQHGEGTRVGTIRDHATGITLQIAGELPKPTQAALPQLTTDKPVASAREATAGYAVAYEARYQDGHEDGGTVVATVDEALKWMEAHSRDLTCNMDFALYELGRRIKIKAVKDKQVETIEKEVTKFKIVS